MIHSRTDEPYGEDVIDRCDSCGDEGTGFVTVQRVYLLLDEDHRPAGEQLADEFETWCPVCRLSYPHQVIDPG